MPFERPPAMLAVLREIAEQLEAMRREPETLEPDPTPEEARDWLTRWEQYAGAFRRGQNAASPDGN